jgi:hypothetical protein
MDEATIISDLARAERHVTASEHHVARQRQVVAERQHEGFDAREATRLLGLFEQLLTLHIAERNRLRKELGDYISATTGSLVRPQVHTNILRRTG